MIKQYGYLKRKKILRTSNFLDLTPIQIHKFEKDASEIVTVLVPRFKSRIITKLLIRQSKDPYIRISLDDKGSCIWLLANGQRKVSEICDLGEAQLGITIHPAKERITTFFSQLYMKKLITFSEIIKT